MSTSLISILQTTRNIAASKSTSTGESSVEKIGSGNEINSSNTVDEINIVDKLTQDFQNLEWVLLFRELISCC